MDDLKIKKENEDLKKVIRELTIQKNMLEDQLYRAFRKCLNTKKRKICELQLEVDRLKKGKKRQKSMVLNIENEDADSQNTLYDENNSSETDVDEDFNAVVQHAHSNLTKKNPVAIDNTKNHDLIIASEDNSSSKLNITPPVLITSNRVEESDSDDSQGSVSLSCSIPAAPKKENTKEYLSSSSTLQQPPDKEKQDINNQINFCESTGRANSEGNYDMDELIGDL